jgi:hypothetical protein
LRPSPDDERRRAQERSADVQGVDGEALGPLTLGLVVAGVALAAEVEVAAQIGRAPAGGAKLLVVVRGEVIVGLVFVVVVDPEVV